VSKDSESAEVESPFVPPVGYEIVGGNLHSASQSPAVYLCVKTEIGSKRGIVSFISLCHNGELRKESHEVKRRNLLEKIARNRENIETIKKMVALD